MFVLSLVLLFLIIRHIGWKTVESSFSAVGLTGAVLLIFLGFTENFLDSAALKHSFLKKLPVLSVWTRNSSGTFINGIIPWEAGEVVKGALLAKMTSASESISAIVIWNYIHKISRPVALIFIMIVSLVFQDTPDYSNVAVVSGAIFLSFIPFLIMHGMIYLELSQKIVSVFGYFSKKNTDEIYKKAIRLDKSIKRFTRDNPYNFLKVFISQFAARIVSWITFVFCCSFIGVNADFSQAGILYCAVSLGTFILSFIPVKIGVGEGAGYVVFSFFGLDGGLGVMVTLFLRMKALITTGILSLSVFRK